MYRLCYNTFVLGKGFFMLIHYCDSEGVEWFYTPEQFLNEAFQLPFDFVLAQIDSFPSMRYHLMLHLLFRAKVEPYISMIKNHPYYDKFIKRIIRQGNVEAKICTVLYFEPHLLNLLFELLKIHIFYLLYHILQVRLN